MAREYSLEISEISATLTSIEKVLDLPKLEIEAVELEAAAAFRICGMTLRKLRR